MYDELIDEVEHPITDARSAAGVLGAVARWALLVAAAYAVVACLGGFPGLGAIAALHAVAAFALARLPRTETAVLLFAVAGLGPLWLYAVRGFSLVLVAWQAFLLYAALRAVLAVRTAEFATRVGSTG